MLIGIKVAMMIVHLLCATLKFYRGTCLFPMKNITATQYVYILFYKSMSAIDVEKTANSVPVRPYKLFSLFVMYNAM